MNEDEFKVSIFYIMHHSYVVHAYLRVATYVASYMEFCMPLAMHM